MQEGAVAFLQMVKITATVAAHKSAHLPYLVYLRHPTTAGSSHHGDPPAISRFAVATGKSAGWQDCRSCTPGQGAPARAPLEDRHQPTAPCICSSISRFSSSAYSIGSSRAIGSTKPRATVAAASSSVMPRLIR